MGAGSWSETGQEWEQDSRLRCQMVSVLKLEKTESWEKPGLICSSHTKECF
jgi:hypothetical protein